MAIRTLEHLTDKVAEDYVWRIREISELKALVDLADISDIRKKVLCRSGVALIYAHWEGFVKKTGTNFLEFVSMQREPVGKLKNNFVTLMLRKRIDSASQSKKYSAFDELTEFLLQSQDKQSNIPYKKVVDTESNLSSTVLKEVAWCLGIDYSFFAAKEKLIDTRLVGKRNHVAHGRDENVDKDDFFELANEVIGLMNIFRNLIENSAAQGSYKRVA